MFMLTMIILVAVDIVDLEDGIEEVLVVDGRRGGGSRNR